MKAAIAEKCCAICAHDIRAGEARHAPLGKDDALVVICATCDDETPQHLHGPDRNYEPDGIGQSFQRLVATSTTKLLGVGDRHATLAPLRHDRTPGYLLVRVPQKVNGKARDQHEAWQTFQHEPWANEVNYLGCFRRYYVWERPDAEAMTEIRRAKEAGTLHDIEIYRRSS